LGLSIWWRNRAEGVAGSSSGGSGSSSGHQRRELERTMHDNAQRRADEERREARTKREAAAADQAKAQRLQDARAAQSQARARTGTRSGCGGGGCRASWTAGSGGARSRRSSRHARRSATGSGPEKLGLNRKIVMPQRPRCVASGGARGQQAERLRPRFLRLSGPLRSPQPCRCTASRCRAAPRELPGAGGAPGT
jgi:hypothetical protein